MESPSAWLKLYMVFCLHVDGNVVNGMAAYQPVVSVCILCGGRTRTIDYVTIDVHTKNRIYSFSQALGDSMKMVPA